MTLITDFTAIISRMLGDWPLGTFVGVLLLLIVLLLAVLIAWGGFIAMDSWFLPRNRGTGKLVSKAFIPAHVQSTLIYNAAINLTLPYPVYHQDDWSLCVDVYGRRDSISVDQKVFGHLSLGENIIADYTIGRLSGGLCIKSISRG
jgi:hypothetical protein